MSLTKEQIAELIKLGYTVSMYDRRYCDKQEPTILYKGEMYFIFYADA